MTATGLFVTGTDTEIGKTLVSCALLHTLRASGAAAVGMKPIASGCESVNGELRNDDALALIQASSQELRYDWVNPYAFEPPIAPHIAAREAGSTIDIAVIAHAYQQLATHADCVVVEGVGGWCVPLSDQLMLSDLAVELALPVLMVVGLRLGCINHALLTQQAIEASGARLLGWIGSAVDPRMAVASQVLETLSDELRCACWGVIPSLDDACPQRAAAYLTVPE